jgi:hypothetical protein
MNSLLKYFLGAGLGLMASIAVLPAQTAVGVGDLPLWFEAGTGGSSGQFTAHGRDAEFSISQAGAGLVLRKADGRTAAVNIQFIGGSLVPKVSGDAELKGKINYFTGSNPAEWQTGIHTFGKVRLENIYPGVNAVFYGNAKNLEYDLSIAAGVEPETIRIRYDGADHLSVNPDGELVIGLNGDKVVQHRPEAYQTDADGTRHEVQAGYKIVDADTVEFAVAEHDGTRPLTIDPILGYSTFFGGNFGDIGWAIALDANTNIYIAGETLSTMVSNGIPFATTLFTNFGGTGRFHGDAFVAELDNTGTNLLYCTYLGGSGDDFAYALAVNAAGEAYVAGLTGSTNFPVTNWIVTATYQGSNISGVFNRNLSGFPFDAFVAKLGVGSGTLEYSTLLGGESTDGAYGLALDPAGDAFVTGFTFSTNFPVTTNAFQATLQCTNSFYVNANAFVSEIAAGGGTLNYSSYLGGTNLDVGRAIAYNNGFVYVAGYTGSTNFPWINGLTNNRILNNFTNINKQRFDFGHDAFVTLFTVTNSTLSPPLYSTFLGSTNDDVATGIAGDASGNAYVVGWTTSTNFPNSTNLLQLSSFVRTNTTSFVIATNAFLTQILLTSSNTASLGYSQMFGGQGIDIANGVALDGAGDVFVVGSASSPSNYPTTGNLFGSLRTTNSSGTRGGRRFTDVVVTVFKSDFTGLLYSGYLGGSAADFGNAITVDDDGNAYITGQTLSTNFPIVGIPGGNGFRSVRDGTNDAFVAKIILNATVPPLFAEHAGTNVLVGWMPFSSQTTPEFLSLQSSTNLIQELITTNNITITNYTYTTNQTTMVVKTNITRKPGKGYVTNYGPDWVDISAATNAVFTNGAYKIKFDPTNQMQFFRFRPN